MNPRFSACKHKNRFPLPTRIERSSDVTSADLGVYPGAVPSYETVASTRVGLNGSYELHAKRIVCTDGCTGSYTVFQLNAFPFCNDGILPPSTPSPKNKKSVDIPETYYLKDKNEKKYFVKDF